MNISAEIIGLDPLKDDPWMGGQNGPVWFVQGRFADGSSFSRGAKSFATAQTLHGVLGGLIGRIETFDVEPAGEYQGTKKVKLKGYPGQPQQGGGGGYGGGGAKREYVPRHRDTPQGAHEERLAIARSVALQQAVAAREAGGNSLKGIIVLADEFYAWLAKDIQAPPAGVMAPQTSGMGAYQKYQAEIATAVQNTDLSRLDKLRPLLKGSLDKGTVTGDEVSMLDDQLAQARQSINKTVAHNEWVKQKQSQATQREPLHPDPRIAATLEQAEEAF